MGEIDTLGILRRICGDALDLHRDLHEESNRHRMEHGEACGVYPSEVTNAPIWPFLTSVVGARRFLEVGCGLGYSAALMAEAGGPSCRVDTIEAVDEHADLAQAEFTRRGLTDRIRILRGEARDILPKLVEPYDVTFLDADWAEFPGFLPHLARLTRPGGILVSANLFPLFAEWAKEMSHKKAVEEYLRLLVQDSRFRTYIVADQWHALSFRLGGP